MGDLINRQDAIDVIEAKEANKYGDYLEYNVAFNDGLHSAIFAIEELPSAEPEQKKNKWIVHNYALGRERYECVECGGRCNLEYKFCPHCGAGMRISYE